MFESWNALSRGPAHDCAPISKLKRDKRQSYR